MIRDGSHLALQEEDILTGAFEIVRTGVQSALAAVPLEAAQGAEDVGVRARPANVTREHTHFVAVLLLALPYTPKPPVC